MPVQMEQLNGQPRILMQAPLKPVQGKRFQPTGFPDLGAAVYDVPGENGAPTQTVLVESAQSVANRLEYVCWDEGAGSIHSAVAGMPYVSVTLWDSRGATNSLLEAHRLNSPYIINDSEFAQRFRADAGLPGGGGSAGSRRRRRRAG